MSGKQTFAAFAIRVYALPGVEQALLALQDEAGADVVVLLWYLWRAADGQTPDAAQGAMALDIAQGWTAETIEPLRAMRRRLKHPIAHMPHAAREKTRRAVKAAELEAEMALIDALSPLRGTPDADAGAGRALAACGAASGRSFDPALTAALCRALQDGPDGLAGARAGPI